jgi:DUF971 family protein
LAVKEVTLADEGINILWDDGHASFYPHRYLRGHCCCAGCVEEMTGRRRVSEENVREDVQALDWMQIGRYAVQFLWSDTHDSGIYPFDLLRKLCHCPDCFTGESDA